MKVEPPRLLYSDCSKIFTAVRVHEKSYQSYCYYRKSLFTLWIRADSRHVECNTFFNSV